MFAFHYLWFTITLSICNWFTKYAIKIINFILEVHICTLSQMHAHTLHTMTVYNILVIMYYIHMMDPSDL